MSMKKRLFKKISNSYTFTVENYDNFFTVNNPKSIFFGTTWLYSTCVIYNRDNEKIWDGIVTQVDRNHNTKTANITTKNNLFKVRNELVSYISSDWETPAEAVKNVLDNIGYTGYNEASINTSIDRYTTADCYIKCNINLEDNMTVQAFIEKLADYGNADAYSHLGELYFVHWKPFTGGVSINLNTNERDKFRSLPQVAEMESDLINDYSIGYDGDGGTPATDADNNNIGNVSRSRYGTHSLPETNSDGDQQIVYKDLTSAVYIGEGYIRRTHKDLTTDPQPLSKISFNLFSDNKEWITLQSYFRLTFSDENWTNKIFEVFEFTIDEDNDDIKLMAYEVVE